VSLLAAIPSPSSNALEIGPLRLNAYGLMIALGVILGVRIAGKALERRGAGTSDDFGAVAMWAVPAGVIGARIYHVVTDWDRFSGNIGDVVKVWQGGLGIWGGIALGVPVGMWAARRRGLDVAVVVTVAAPAIAAAQAVGRWGNWFNQELFGKPTDLPWALRVSDAKATAAGFDPGTTFHPTFLYESLWCAVLCIALLAVNRRGSLKPGRVFWLYAAGYTLMRFFIEGLRIDRAHEAGGLRLNQWVSLVVFVVSVALFAVQVRADRRPGSSVAIHEPQQ
jgi:prolipoprotein diacylglyceryl transferase